MTDTPTRLFDRTLLRISGDDPCGFLQGLVTHDLALLAPDRPLWTGLLTPQGKALFDFVLWADGDAVLVDCAAKQAEALARRLALYRLRRAITIVPVAGGVHWVPNGPTGVADPRSAVLGRRWLTADTVAPGDDASDEWRRHRLALGVTEGIAELGDGTTLWLECNADLLDGVSFTKGCYVGQENTARMHYRAKVNRRLAVVPATTATDLARMRTSYIDPAVAIELRRVEHWGDALRPAWLALPA